MSRSAEARASLLERQMALVAALTGRGDLPPGFDEERVRAAAESLAQKRSRATARAWFELSMCLGDRFAELFAAYALVTPLPIYGGPLADGREFARWLANRGELPESGQIQALAVDLRYTRVPGGMIRRNWPTCSVMRLRQSRRLVVAVRLPWLGEHWLRIPF